MALRVGSVAVALSALFLGGDFSALLLQNLHSFGWVTCSWVGGMSFKLGISS